MRAPFDIAADLDTPVSAFLKLAPLQPRFLLESVVGGETQGRYSFIGFGEADRVRLDPTGLWRNGDKLCDGRDQADLLDGWRRALAAAPHPGRGHELPFTGGLVGFAGYDVVRRFERVPELAAPTPGPEGEWVATRSLLCFDHATRRCAVLHDGDSAECESLRRDVVMALRGAIPARKNPFGASGFRSGGYSSPRGTLSRGEYEAGVRTIQAAIHEGDVYQLVLAGAFEGESSLDPFQAYRALRLLNPSPYMVYLELEETTVVGSSPEALVKLNGRQAELRPIAGTRPRGVDPEEDLALELELLADPKEASEHVMLVDLARNDLGRVAVAGTVRVEPYRTIERYSHVMHIVSGVKGTVRGGIDCFDLFAATFPAGTVVGAPKVRAMELIESLEPCRRGVYAGTVGYFGHGGAMDQAIAIRTLWFREGRYRYQAGAGVVADSVPSKEYDEIRAKAGALEAALRLAEEGL